MFTEKKTLVFFGFLLVFVFVSSFSALAIDFGGRTITIISKNGVLEDSLKEGGAFSGRAELAEEKFNISIEYMNLQHRDSGIDQLMTRVMSGDSEYDIIGLSNFELYLSYANGLLLPLNDYISEDSFQNYDGFQMGLINYGTIKGYKYIFGNIPYAADGLATFWYNKQLLEMAGVPNPYELWQEGEWTWEKMKMILQESNYRMGGTWNNAHAFTNNAYEFYEKDGRILYGMADANFIEAVEFLVEIRDIGAEEVAMKHWIPRRRDDLFDGNWQVVPLPKGPKSDNHVSGAQHSMGLFALPVTSAAPEDMIEITNFLFPQDEYDKLIEQFLIENSPDPKSFEAIKWAYENFSGLIISQTALPGTNQPIRDAWREIFEERRAPATVFREIEPLMQSALDTVFN